MTTLKLQSPMAGFYSFIIFNIPSWILMLIIGTLANHYVDDYNTTQVKLAFLGFNAATAGVLVRSFVQYFRENAKNISTVLLMLYSAGVFFFFRSTSSVIFCLITGAIFSLYM